MGGGRDAAGGSGRAGRAGSPAGPDRAAGADQTGRRGPGRARRSGSVAAGVRHAEQPQDLQGLVCPAGVPGRCWSPLAAPPGGGSRPRCGSTSSTGRRRRRCWCDAPATPTGGRGRPGGGVTWAAAGAGAGRPGVASGGAAAATGRLPATTWRPLQGPVAIPNQRVLWRPDLCTVYVGSPAMSRLPTFRSPVAGLPMSHWR